MKKESVCILSDLSFKRAVGVQHKIFDVILEKVKKNIRYSGDLSNFDRTNHLLMTLMHWREYQTESKDVLIVDSEQSSLQRKEEMIHS